ERVSTRNTQSLYPTCFVRAANLHHEMQTLRGDKEWKDSLPENIAFRVIAMHRDCDEFTPWMQGFTPKEHVEMQQEQARLHWQKRREEADRRWREEQADQAHRWRQDDQR